MIGVVATMRIKEGTAEAFERHMTDLAAKVKANEPGNVVYQLTKSRTEPNTYKVLELYASQEALTAHGQSEHFKAAGPGFRDVLAGRPEIEYLDAVS